MLSVLSALGVLIMFIGHVDCDCREDHHDQSYDEYDECEQCDERNEILISWYHVVFFNIS